MTSSSLIDVDTPSVHTVPSDFAEQDIQTETQAARIEHDALEKDIAAKARAEADFAKKKTRRGVQKADSWLTKQFTSMSEGASSALVLGNLVTIVGISGWLGFKAWSLYDRGRLDWKTAGYGLGLLATVGAVESVFAR